MSRPSLEPLADRQSTPKGLTGRHLAELAGARIVIVGPGTPGSVLQYLASYTMRHAQAHGGVLTFITHPIPYSWSRITESLFVDCVGDRTNRQKVVPRHPRWTVASCLVDMASTAKYLLGLHRRFDIYIAAGLHLILLGLMLKRLGLARRAVGWAMDYWPARFGASWLDRLYRLVNEYCFRRMDYVLCPPLAADRFRHNGLGPIAIPVPHMVQAWEIGSLPQHLVPAHSVVWAGAATLEYGFELLLDALPVVVGECPSVVVDVTSYESSPERWQKEIARRGLEPHFRFVGFIAEEDEFRRFVRRHRAGLATYHPSVSSQKLYAEVSRPLAYMASGVPPIITRVPRQAAEIEQWGAGLVIDYRPESLAKAMVALLTDDELHQRCRIQGLEVAHRHDAEVICREVFAQLGLQTNLPTGEHS